MKHEHFLETLEGHILLISTQFRGYAKYSQIQKSRVLISLSAWADLIHFSGNFDELQLNIEFRT